MRREEECEHIADGDELHDGADRTDDEATREPQSLPLRQRNRNEHERRREREVDPTEIDESCHAERSASIILSEAKDPAVQTELTAAAPGPEGIVASVPR